LTSSSTQPTNDFTASILIVDDHAAVRRGLRTLISTRPGWVVCGEAADGEQAIVLALQLKPSVVVMDISMPVMDGLEATRRIRERLPGVEVVIVSQHDSEHVVSEAQRIGARGFVMKSHLSADLLPSLEAALLHSSRISAPLSKAWQNAVTNANRAPAGPFIDPGPHDDLDLMSGGGEMGSLMRSKDWATTPFGPVSSWPQSLRTALRICLDSRFPILIWWGPELRLLYNDAYRPALGTTKYPNALGAPGRDVWSDIWDTIGPMLEGVMRTGQATWENDQLLLFDRLGYVEESYWTYSYSAIRLASGEVGGVFSAIHEVTDRVLIARRLKTLREVADQLVQAKNELDACTLAMQSIVRNPADCPYAMIFLCNAEKATRVAASFDAGPYVQSTIDLAEDDPWCVGEAVRTRAAQVFRVKNPESMPNAPYGAKCEQAISIPILGTTREAIAVMTVGVSPYRALDEAYREFFELLARNLAANVNNARAYEEERKLLAEADEARERLSKIIDALPAAIYTTDPEGRITHFNPAAVEFSGRTPKLGDMWCVTWKLLYPDGSPLPHEECPMAIALKEGRILKGGEYMAERPDGTRVWFRPFPNLLRDGQGNVVAGINMLLDVTDQRKAQEATSLLANIVASSDDAIVSKNLNGVITSWNQGAEHMFGYTAHEAIGQHITLIIPRDRYEEETQILARLRRGEKVDHFRTVRVRKDCSTLDVSLTISPVKDFSGRIIGASKVARDVTNESRAERYLRESEERFRAIVETTPECVTLVARDGTLLHMNSSGLRMIGAARLEQISGTSIYNLIAPEDREIFRVFTERVCAGQRGSLGFEIVRHDGGRRHMDARAAPLRNPDGTVVQLAVMRDITDRKRAEEREREITREAVAATAKFRAVFEQTTQFAGIMTKDGILIDANKLSLAPCGYTSEEVLGRPFWETKWWRAFPESQRKIKAATTLVAQGVPYRETLRYSFADGTERLVDFALFPIVDRDGQVIFLHPTGVDITDRKAAEENSRKLAESLEAEVRARTKELEQRNAEVVMQSDQLRDLSWHLLRTQDEERRHIARELHDSAGQTLAVLGMNVEQLVQKAAHASPELTADAEAIEETVRQLHRDIRTTSYLLHPPLLDESGLSSALQWYVQGLLERSGLNIALDISEDFGRLPREMELVVFRLVQECLTNIHRHSGSSTAQIKLTRGAQEIRVDIRDQGKGMSPERLAEVRSGGSGVGVRGMRERLRQFSGSMLIESGKSGTRVFVIIPLANALPAELGGAEPLEAAV
jgi:PAS domain S-box-containing protein